MRVFTEEPKRIPIPASIVTTTKPKTTAQKTLAVLEKQKKIALEQAQKRIQLSERYKSLSINMIITKSLPNNDYSFMFF